MHPEVDELRPKLKEILYDCAVDIRATKAALYLYDGSSRFELATEYGFRGSARQSADFNDPMADRCGRGRTPFIVNGLAAEPRFSELLFESATEFLLAAPLYSRGKLVGFIDMRDKAGRQPFEQADLAKAQSIAERIVALFANMNVFGHRMIALSEAEEHASVETLSGAVQAPSQVASMPLPPNVLPKPSAAAASRPAAVAEPPAAPPKAQPAPPARPDRGDERAHLPRLASLVIDARKAASSIIVAPSPESIGEAEIAAARDVLKTILLIPGAVAATLSAFGHLGGLQEIATRGPLTEDARNLIQSKLNVWLTKRGEAGGIVRTSVQTPAGASGAPVTAADVQKVFTAPLTVGSMRGLYLTVVFSEAPDRAAHELLAALHAALQNAIEQSISRTTFSVFRVRAADMLVEPQFTSYRELRRHTNSVVALTESFAQFIALTPAETENARLVAMVHDCGMRLLDYDRNYCKRDLTQEELSFLREHPAVGAAMVEPLLGADIARAVLCHHERVDGRGYPNELHGDEIPMLARVVQICDAYAAMTEPVYQPAEPREAALTTITRGANAQFDGELASRFVEMMKSRRG